MQGYHHVGCSLLALQGLSPVLVRLRNAHVPTPLSSQLYVAVKLRRIIGINPLFFKDVEGVLLYLGRSNPACGEGLVVLMDYKIDFFVL